jgi:hypothetical protein
LVVREAGLEMWMWVHCHRVLWMVHDHVMLMLLLLLMLWLLLLLLKLVLLKDKSWRNNMRQGRRSVAIDHVRRPAVREGRWVLSVHVWRQMILLAMILVHVMVRGEVDKCCLPWARCLCLRMWPVPVPVDVGRVAVRCMLGMSLLYGRAVAILKPKPAVYCCSLLRQLRLTSLLVRHYKGNSVSFRKVLFDHPWCPNPFLSVGCFAQILLEDNLGVLSSVTLELRSPVLDDLFFVVLERDFIRERAHRLVY